MSLKPTVIREVLADIATMTKTIGPKLGKMFSPNPKIAKYAYVLQFPSDGVVTSRALAQALKKLPEPRGSTLLAGYDFTVEARKMAHIEACDLISNIEFGWTDARYADRMR
jgi:hypothetical protein